MGIKDFNKTILSEAPEASHTVVLECELHGIPVAIDLSFWLHGAAFVKKHGHHILAGSFERAVSSIVSRSNYLTKLGASLVFVADDRLNKSAAKAIEDARRASGRIASRALYDAEGADKDKHLFSAFKITAEFQDAVIKGLREANHDVVQSYLEADHQIGKLFREHVVYAVIGNDQDLYAHGVDRLLYNCDLFSKSESIKLFEFNHVKPDASLGAPLVRQLAACDKLTRLAFVRLYASIAGCDYLDIKGAGPACAKAVTLAAIAAYRAGSLDASSPPAMASFAAHNVLSQWKNPATVELNGTECASGLLAKELANVFYAYGSPPVFSFLAQKWVPASFAAPASVIDHFKWTSFVELNKPSALNVFGNPSVDLIFPTYRGPPYCEHPVRLAVPSLTHFFAYKHFLLPEIPIASREYGYGPLIPATRDRIAEWLKPSAHVFHGDYSTLPRADLLVTVSNIMLLEQSCTPRWHAFRPPESIRISWVGDSVADPFWGAPSPPLQTRAALMRDFLAERDKLREGAGAAVAPRPAPASAASSALPSLPPGEPLSKDARAVFDFMRAFPSQPPPTAQPLLSALAHKYSGSINFACGMSAPSRRTLSGAPNPPAVSASASAMAASAAAVAARTGSVGGSQVSAPASAAPVRIDRRSGEGLRFFAWGIHTDEWQAEAPVLPYAVIEEIFATHYSSSLPKSLRKAEAELFHRARPPPAILALPLEMPAAGQRGTAYVYVRTDTSYGKALSYDVEVELEFRMQRLPAGAGAASAAPKATFERIVHVRCQCLAQMGGRCWHVAQALLFLFYAERADDAGDDFGDPTRQRCRWLLAPVSAESEVQLLRLNDGLACAAVYAAVSRGGRGAQCIASKVGGRGAFSPLLRAAAARDENFAARIAARVAALTRAAVVMDDGKLPGIALWSMPSEELRARREAVHATSVHNAKVVNIELAIKRSRSMASKAELKASSVALKAAAPPPWPVPARFLSDAAPGLAALAAVAAPIELPHREYLPFFQKHPSLVMNKTGVRIDGAASAASKGGKPYFCKFCPGGWFASGPPSSGAKKPHFDAAGKCCVWEADTVVARARLHAWRASRPDIGELNVPAEGQTFYDANPLYARKRGRTDE